MKSDLDELIELLEAEAKLIEACIKENIDEWDYQMAEYNSRGLSEIQQKLTVLNKMKDPLYDEKRNLERMIILREKSDRTEMNVFLDDYYRERLEIEKNELQKLNQRKSIPFYDDQKIDDALFSVWAGIYKGFKLFLKDDLYFVFEPVGDEVLNISIDAKSALNIDYFFDIDEEDKGYRMLGKFQGLGFVLNNSGNELIYRYYMGNLKDASKVKLLLSRIVYDLLRYAELDKTARLEWF